MAPDKNSTLYDEIISELEKMPDIEIHYHCAEDTFTDNRYLYSGIFSRKTIVVNDKKYTSMAPKKKYAVNPLDRIERYLKKKDTLSRNLLEGTDPLDFLRKQGDGKQHKVSIYYAEQPEDAESLLMHLGFTIKEP